MQKYSHGRKQLERMQYRLSVAGNGLFLAGSILYVTDGGDALGTWAFVLGSAMALLSSLLPQLIQVWFCPTEDEPDHVRSDREPPSALEPPMAPPAAPGAAA